MKFKKSTSTTSSSGFMSRLFKLTGSFIIFLSVLNPAAAQAQTDNASFFSNMNDTEMVLFFAMLGLLLLTLLVIVVFFYVLAVLRLLRNEGKAVKQAANEKAPTETQGFWARMNKKFGSGELLPVEQENEIMMDHTYDGISELNNSMPPWLKYLFYVTIGFAVVYVLHYLVLETGKLQLDEYQEELALAAEEATLRAEAGGTGIDENNVTLVTDAAALEEAKTLYVQNCAACHGADGGGTVGPNLADEYWLHGGTVQDVFRVIKYGVQEKGMIPWQDKLNPEQIQIVASYILSLQGTTPASPKEPQGEKVEMKEIATVTATVE